MNEISLAISGGGIRSATFAFGFLQALVKSKIINFIHTLSTVSGGGFIGAYFSLTKDKDQNLFFDNNMNYAKYLRNNSNYLCPNGPLDYVYLAASYFRNWIFLLLVIISMIIPWFLLIRTIDNLGYLLITIGILALISGFAISFYAFIKKFLPRLFILPVAICSFFITDQYFTIFYYIVAIYYSIFLFFLYKKYNDEIIEYKCKGFSNKSILIGFIILSIGLLDYLGTMLYNNGINLIYILIPYGVFISTIFGKITNAIETNKTIKIFLVKLLGLIPLILLISTVSYFSHLIYNYYNIYIALIISFIVFFLLGNYTNIINYCSLQPIFEEKIRNAYIKPAIGYLSLSDKKVIDIPLHKYNTYFHIMNVCCNKTILEDSQIDAIHRKGQHLFLDKWNFHNIDLSKALSISAAAASPGMGYKTSIFQSIFLFILNIRLGYWVIQKKEFLGLYRCIIDECFGFYQGLNGNRMYLTDGGHFENLGLYELLKRKKKFIICIDAEYDPLYKFHGLSKLIRQARTDLGCEIRFIDNINGFKRSKIKNKSKNFTINNNEFELDSCSGFSKVYFVKGIINYKDGTTGELYYIKPSLIGKESLDIINYYNNNPQFPQENTTDQFFSEEQWESYRKLGNEIGEEFLRKINNLYESKKTI